MNKDSLIKLLKDKIAEFNMLYPKVQLFKHSLLKWVDFPEHPHCTNDVQMNRLLRIRSNEIATLRKLI